MLDANRQQHRIRLTGIDAPESKQAFGGRSRQNLSGLVFGKDVAVEWEKHDRYKRIMGKVLVDESSADCGFRDCRKSLDAGLQQIRDGMAWRYKQYQRDQSAADREPYAAAKVTAQANHVGLWRNGGPLAPCASPHRR